MFISNSLLLAGKVLHSLNIVATPANMQIQVYVKKFVTIAF